LALGAGPKPIRAEVRIHIRQSNLIIWAASQLKTVWYVVRSVRSS